MNIARAIIGENNFRDRGSAILPIGGVNLTTGANKLFGTLWDGWPEGDGTNFLVASKTYPGALPGVSGQPGQMRVVHTSGTMSDVKEGSIMRFVHDQTRRPIGDEWVVLGAFPHTKEGLAQLKAKSGKSSLPFATFK